MNQFAVWIPAILTPTLTFAIVAIGIFLNNKRIDDMRDLLRAEMRANQVETNAHYAELKQMLTVLLGKVDELEERVSRLEERRS